MSNCMLNLVMQMTDSEWNLPSDGQHNDSSSTPIVTSSFAPDQLSVSRTDSPPVPVLNVIYDDHSYSYSSFCSLDGVTRVVDSALSFTSPSVLSDDSIDVSAALAVSSGSEVVLQSLDDNVSSFNVLSSHACSSFSVTVQPRSSSSVSVRPVFIFCPCERVLNVLSPSQF